jgi:molybdate transport system substrate-binding protein
MQNARNRADVAHFGNSPGSRRLDLTAASNTMFSLPELTQAGCQVMKVLRFTVLTSCLAALALLTDIPARSEEPNATELVVAAAADLSSALRELGDSFQKQTGIRVKFSFGASGMLTQEIQNGAPFDVFLSADMDYPRQLISAGAADAASLYQYAVGKLVLWVPADSKLKLEQDGMNVLLDPSVQKISIANAQNAPYGRAAVAALKHAGLYQQVAPKLVMGENVAQAAQFVESGNAQVGFIARAHAVAPGMGDKGRSWEVPSDYYPPLAQGAVLLSHARHKSEGANFLEFLKTKEAAAVLEKYGFIPSRN